MPLKPNETRLRAPSARSLETRTRIVDAAERLFAARGYDGTSMRDIATEADVHVGLVSHHGGNKIALFHYTVGRRAGELSQRRVDALEQMKAKGDLTVADVLRCFVDPLLTLSQEGGPQWRAYARLVAYVSADDRWRTLAEVCFDPAAQKFVDELVALKPDRSRALAAATLVYTVSALLAQITSSWRIDALAGERSIRFQQHRKMLLDFCVAGAERLLD
ncbi:MAG: TetR family transcriptional regulator [Rhodobacteraceae bacterium]|jgi:AcrR family transcriptional regulator|nr:TetR family transcriptional regulator [Paracoccaceae bacterium]